MIFKQYKEITDNLFNRWEQKILENNIIFLVCFWKKTFFQIDKYFCNVDFFNTQMVLKQLLAYDWT